MKLPFPDEPDERQLATFQEELDRELDRETHAPARVPTTRGVMRLPPAQILDVSPDDYHLRPGLSASIATTLVMRSPLHAWDEHPVLGGNGRAATREMDFGSVAHALTLGKGKRFAPVPFDDYRTKAAQQTRDRYRAEGLIPILHHQLERTEEATAAALRQLEEREIVLDGQSELAVEWYEPSRRGPVLCRCMFDHVWIDAGRILDLKFVGNAETQQLERSAERFGYAIQAHAYKRALVALRPKLEGRVEFLFAFVESDRPHALNLTAPDGSLREIGERRWRRAVERWAECMETYGKDTPWPGYGGGINRLSAPAWALAREEI